MSYPTVESLRAEALEQLPSLLPGIDLDRLSTSYGRDEGIFDSSGSFISRADSWFLEKRDSRVMMWNNLAYEPERPYFHVDMNEVPVFEGQIVVDLGAGHHSCGYMHALMDGARAYVGVELNNYDGLANQRHSHMQTLEHRNQDAIPFIIVSEPLERFVQRLPDSSVSFIMSGLWDVAEKAVDKAKDDIERALHPNGSILLSYSPNVFDDFFERDLGHVRDLKGSLFRGEFPSLCTRREITSEETARAYFMRE